MPRRTIVAALLLAAIAACRPAPAADAGWSRVEAAAFTTELSAAQPNALTIVDVREPELFAAGHIPGAINLPWPDAKTRAPAELQKTQDIVLVCHGGPMGDELAAILAAQGFPKVRNLAGGMNGWSGPVTTGG